MEKYKRFEIILHTAWGDMLLSDAKLDLPKGEYVDILTEDHDKHERLANAIKLTWVAGTGWKGEPITKNIFLGCAVWGDVQRFVKWNNEHDERHQINLDSVRLHKVHLTPHANKVQLEWMFLDPVGTARVLIGLPNSLSTMSVFNGQLGAWPDDEFTVYF